MDEHRLKALADRYKQVGERISARREEERRKAEESARRSASAHQTWNVQKVARLDVVESVNAELADTGFRLKLDDSGRPRMGDLDVFGVHFAGTHHPSLVTAWLTVALQEDAQVRIERIGLAKRGTPKEVPFEQFTMDAWKREILDFLEDALPAN